MGKKVKIEEHLLVSMLKAMDKSAFEILYDNYSTTLYNVILKIVQNEELAEDILQETFVKIWKKVESYDASKGTLFTWLLNISRNSAIDKVRSKSFRNNLKIQPIEDNVGLIDSNYSEYSAVDFIGLDKVVAQLSDDHKELIDLLYFKGYTQSEVAEEFNMPLGTVKTRIRAAIIKLRELLN